MKLIVPSSEMADVVVGVIGRDAFVDVRFGVHLRTVRISANGLWSWKVREDSVLVVYLGLFHVARFNLGVFALLRRWLLLYLNLLLLTPACLYLHPATVQDYQGEEGDEEGGKHVD